MKYLRGKDDIPYCTFNGDAKDGNGYIKLADHVTLLDKQVEFKFSSNLNAYLSNFISLGILVDMSSQCKVDKTTYNAIRENYNLKKMESIYVPKTFKSISVKESFYRITDFGKLFIKACVK